MKRTYSLIISCSLTLLFINSLVAKPLVIPSIKEWQAESGHLIINSKARIIIDPNYNSELNIFANTLQKDLKDLKKWDLQIIVSGSPEKGDIFLTENAKLIMYGEESYSFSIKDNIEISGFKANGTFWGTRTLLQLLKHTDSIECGNIIDYPDYPERGLMIDLSRKYYSIQWLENHIRELSYLKMNLFHLHLSDNEGFRMECSTYPQIQSEQRYSKAELKNLIELASSYNIEIIPEIDMPNHMSAIMKNFPDAWLIDSLGNNLGECCMDFTLDTARKVVSNILDEYLPLFPGRYWHMGADEYITNFDLFPHIIKWVKQKYGENAQPQEAYFDFINWIDSTVKSYGKTLRTWNDWSDNTADLTFTTSVNKDVVIDHWQGNFPPQRFIDEGYRINNCSQRHMYYFVANPSINNPLIYEEWTPLLFSKYVNVENKNNKVQGAKIAVWSDLPDTETETQTAKAILKVLRIVAQKTWNFNDSPLEYKDFESEINQIGVAPLIQYPENPIPNNLAYLKPIYASSVESNSDEFSSEMANDGDYYTRWASHLTDKEWIYIDFGEIIEFTRVKLRWEYAYATQYALQISNDADNWTDIYETFNGNGEVDDITTLKSKARYLKLDFRKRVAWNGYSLWEIEVYDSSKINSSYSETLSSFGNISPNPATDYITIIQPSDGFLVEIYDVMGVLIQSTKFNLTQHPPLMGERLRIDVANLFPGVYFVKIGDRFEKFVKI